MIDTESFSEQLRSSSALSFARSLFDAAEGKELFSDDFAFAGAVSTYYSVFHLGGALILAYCSYPSPPTTPTPPCEPNSKKNGESDSNVPCQTDSAI